MNDQLAGVYLRQVDAQCRYALGAIVQLNFQFDSYLKGQEGGQQDQSQQRYLQHELFRSLQSFVQHTGNVANLLWPWGEGAPVTRGSDLCARIGVEENSLLNSPQVHAAAQPFAQRFTAWVGDNGRGHSEEVGIGPLESNADSERNLLCWYDPNDKWFVFLGKSYDVQNLATALEDLLPAVNSALAALRQ